MGCTWGGVLYGFRTKNNLSAKYADGIRGSVVPAASAAGADKREPRTITVLIGSAASAAGGGWCKNQPTPLWGWGY